MGEKVRDGFFYQISVDRCAWASQLLARLCTPYLSSWSSDPNLPVAPPLYYHYRPRAMVGIHQANIDIRGTFILLGC